MQKNKIIAVIAMMAAIFILYSAAPALAGTNSIGVNPGVISVGQTTTITVTTDKAASGALKVKDPNGNIWTADTPISIGAGGGSQQWVYPTDFTGADTNTIGTM